MLFRIATSLVLVAITVFGFISILSLAEWNGWMPMFQAVLSSEDNLLPGTDKAGRTEFTGFSPVDYALSRLIRFFYPSVSGQSPVLSLFTAYMAGQILAVHTAVELEGLRIGNADTPMSL